MTIRIEDLRKEGMKKSVTAFRAGQTVRVHRKIKEGDKERIQIFDGLVIQVRNGNSLSAAITVRKIFGGIGVEQVFPVHSPLIEKIELVKEAKVRRGRLYFMRNLQGKAARLKERFFTEEELRNMKPVEEVEVLEAVPEEAEENTQVEEKDEAITNEATTSEEQQEDSPEAVESNLEQGNEEADKSENPSESEEVK